MEKQLSNNTSQGQSALNAFFTRYWLFIILIAIIVLFPLVIKSYFVTRVGLVLALTAINVAGMTLLVRYAGVVSLGHSAFYALGAYVSAILCMRAGVNPWIGMVVAAGASTAVAYVFSVPFLKLRMIYLAMATLGLGEVAVLLAKDLTNVTGGVAGIPGIPHLSILGYKLDQDWQLFYLFGAVLVGFVYLTENLGRTRLGRAYHAIRTNETAAQAMGINVQKEIGKLFCFTALISSVTGSLLAHFITFISPESFTMDWAFTLLSIVIIGGPNIWACLVTAVVLVSLSEVLRGFQDLSSGFYGLLLVVALFVFPDGLSASFGPWIRGRKKKAAKAQEGQSCSFGDPANVWPVIQGPQCRSGKMLDLTGISKAFGGTQALSDVAISVEFNQIVGIIGPNGAGKTTLLNVINGFLVPTPGGKILFRDKDVTKKAPHQMAEMGLGRTFQLVNLFKGMTVLENVMVGGHLKGNSGIWVGGLNLGKPRDEETVIFNSAMSSLEFLGLTERAYDVVESLPFGEQRLVEMARALSMRPDVLLLDEPAAGLNTAETEKLAGIIRRIKEKGVTVVLVEHNMPLVMSVSDKVFVLDFGRGIAFGTPEEVKKDKEVIRAYLGQEG